MNIYQKIVEIRKTVDVFIKDSKGHNYDYVSGAQVLSKIKTKMDELGVVLEPQLLNLEHEIHRYTNKYNKECVDFLVWGAMKMVWINSDDPSDRAEVMWQMAGQQDEISKALGSGLTYSERYFLLKYFGVPTDKDDPDAKKPQQTQQQKQQTTPPFQPQQQSNPDIISDAQVKGLFAISNGKTDKAKEILKRYGYESSKDIKKADYEKICKELEAV